MILTSSLRLFFSAASSFLLALGISCCDAPRTESGSLLQSAVAANRVVPPDSIPADAPSSLSSFDLFLQTEFPPADGFDFPLGDPNEKRNGSKPEQPVLAVANGRVTAARNFGPPLGNVVAIEHVFYENNEKRTVRSVYSRLDSVQVKAGETVRRRERIGTIRSNADTPNGSPFHLEIQTDTTLPPGDQPSAEGRDRAWIDAHYAEPEEFINAHRTLFVPQGEPRLVLIEQESYRMRFYKDGKLHGEYDLCFGLTKGGMKRLEGDMRTPKGMYFITEREKGKKITGPTAPYMGGYWMKLNYPNKYDAAWGYEQGHITKEEEKEIASLWNRRRTTPQQTHLGGGIGIHGWISEWDNDATRHRSWGCVVMHNRDIPKVYDLIPAGTMVVIW